MIRILIALAISPYLDAQTTELDTGIAGAEGHLEVFVRMADQVCGTAQSYTAFCKKHAKSKRRALRTEVLRQLTAKSERSYAAIAGRVKELGPAVQDVQRYWIVNGFACRATAAACAKLAAEDAVAFIYKKPIDRLPPLHRSRPSVPPRLRRRMERNAKRILSMRREKQRALDVEKLEPSWNIKKIRADVAWRQGATGRGVTIAMMDSGILPTPALAHALWTNDGETLNGKDDDGNGLVDDLFGYDFRFDQGLSVGEFGRATHGSMCGGILAGRPVEVEGKLFTPGVAPAARLMVLRGMGSLRACEYAVKHGADVVSMSYMWVNMELGNWRGLYRLAYEHMTAAGVVSVGGSGNFQQSAPQGRQICLPKDIPCVISASGLDQSDQLPKFSSLGPCTWQGVVFYDDYPPERPLVKPDVTAFSAGFACWTRVPKEAAGRLGERLVYHDGGNCGLMVGPRGNSFAGPHAGGVAALMLSVNPDLPAWRVKELMERTCRDLGEKGRDVRFGAGLVDAAAAVKAARAAAGQ